MTKFRWFLPQNVDDFFAFYMKPIIYFNQPDVLARLGWTDITKGIGKLLAVTIPLLVQEYEIAHAAYLAAFRTPNQHVAWEVLRQKQKALGNAYNKLRNALNSNPDHTVDDNNGSGLPAEKNRKKHLPAPVMNDSNPVIDNVIEHAADQFAASFHDSADTEKRHKLPYRQKGAFLALVTSVTDPIPTREEVIATGKLLIATRSPLRNDFGVDKQGYRLNLVPYWVNTRNQRGRYGELQSFILT